MARLYGNENFPFPVVAALRNHGHDVVTTEEAGKAGQRIPDDEVLKYAIAEDRAVLTLNRKHFLRLHKQSSAHAGIIVCSFDPDYDAQAQRIHDAIEGQGDLHGQLLRVNRLP